jgi:hypothetical protein
MRSRPKPPVPISLQESFFILVPRRGAETLSTFGRILAAEATFGKSQLSALQPRDRSRTEICRHVHVCADGRSQAAAKVVGTAHLFLPAVLSLAGPGPSAGRRTQHRRMANDPRPGQRRPSLERGRVGESAGRGGFASIHGN